MTQETKKLYVSITAGEETYYFTKAEGLRLLSEEFDRIERDKNDTGNEYGYEWDWHWMTEEEFNEVSDTPDKPTFEPLPPYIEEEARKYAAEKVPPATTPGDVLTVRSSVREFVYAAFIAGSQLRPDTSRFREKIETILDLPQEEWREGATYGDTKFDSPSAAYGYNMCLEYVKQIASEALNNTSGEEKQESIKVLNIVKGGSDYTNKVHDYILMLDTALSDKQMLDLGMLIQQSYHITKK